MSVVDSLETHLVKYILEVYEKCDRNQYMTADVLKISRSTLHRHLKAEGLTGTTRGRKRRNPEYLPPSPSVKHKNVEYLPPVKPAPLVKGLHSILEIPDNE